MFLWSLKTNLRVRDEDIGIHQCYDKKEPAQHVLGPQQRAPGTRRSASPASAPSLLSEMATAERTIHFLYLINPVNPTSFTTGPKLVFHSGILVSLSLSGPQLEKVVIDRTLVGKLISDTISDAVLTDNFIILSFEDHNQLCFIQFTRKMDSPDVNKRLEKLSCLDLKVLSYVRTEWDPLHASFSCQQPYQVLTVEHSVSAAKDPMADSCVYKCLGSKIQCAAVTRIPLPSRAISCCRDVTEDKLVLGCEDSSIILYEAYNQVTLLAQAELLPAVITYHPSGAVFIVGSSQGELQLFDTALSPVKIQLLAQDYSPEATLQFSKHFEVPSSLTQIQWAAPPAAFASPDSTDIHDLLLVRFDKGPLGVLHFKLGVITRGQLGLVEIIHQYIQYDEIHQAINVLNTMNWNTMGHQCYICLSAICNHLLKQKLTPDREAQLEASLGTFYAPTRPLLDTTVLEYRDPISRYARRFFHHLLRYQRFEKAFLLAVDINARDLFMDIHYLALDKGELALAEVAKRKANDIDAESITTGIELLGQSEEEDPSCEAFIDQPSEQGGEHNPPAPGPAIRPPVQSCSHRPTSCRQVDETESGMDGHTTSLIRKPFPSSQEGDQRQRISPNRALRVGVIELPQQRRGNLTKVVEFTGSPSENFQPALDLTTSR
ncbi:WD repeat-containing and planar cell polarity effector protein fritz isoform X1 [Willisornis vidua]|uniref:WD repeat-containing and planar cell polarity effector protein fritz isoform X1 n=1 Tax=Willisornis vidua TaxID=1566151 RepID=A0ABQ9CVY6_9PASS|nr:WD repeat-containing and planar cell polarity effector protein fritz isoform X1 [Willisornis vidua]